MGQVTITEAQTGSTVPAMVGDVIAVVLPEIPTSGYRWSLENGNEDELEPVDSAFHPAEGAGLDGGGTRVFRFEVRGPGRAHIRLKLWRAWEGERSIRERFEAWVSSTG